MNKLDKVRIYHICFTCIGAIYIALATKFYTDFFNIIGMLCLYTGGLLIGILIGRYNPIQVNKYD